MSAAIALGPTATNCDVGVIGGISMGASSMPQDSAMAPSAFAESWGRLGVDCAPQFLGHDAGRRIPLGTKRLVLGNPRKIKDRSRPKRPRPLRVRIADQKVNAIGRMQIPTEEFPGLIRVSTKPSSRPPPSLTELQNPQRGPIVG